MTTFQMQTPVGGGTPQTAGSVPPGNRQNVGQSTRQTVTRTWNPIGAFLQPGFAPGYIPSGIGFDLTNQGVMIASIEPSGVYYQSGLRKGDVVVSSYGRPVQTEADFQSLASSRPDQPMPVVVLRDGRQQTIEVHPQQFPAYLGVQFALEKPDGATVISVTSRSPAESAGLRPGDTITALNGERIASYQRAMQILSSMQPGDRIDISFTRRVENQTRAVLDSLPSAVMQTAAYPSDVRAERVPVPSAPSEPNGQIFSQ
jgi:S1-C subfamily serine protease